jgi:hypothetical protein
MERVHQLDLPQEVWVEAVPCVSTHVQMKQLTRAPLLPRGMRKNAVSTPVQARVFESRILRGSPSHSYNPAGFLFSLLQPVLENPPKSDSFCYEYICVVIGVCLLLHPYSIVTLAPEKREALGARSSRGRVAVVNCAWTGVRIIIRLTNDRR